MYPRQCIASDEPVVIAFDIMQDDKVNRYFDVIERDTKEVFFSFITYICLNILHSR